MTASGNLYAKGIVNALNGDINFTSDSIKLALVSGYTPNFASDQYWSTPQADEITGTGYTAGGAALSSKSLTATAANSWANTWEASTAFTVGTVIRPATGNGYLYQCAVAGTSGSSAPSFPTVEGQTVTDGGATWTCMGIAIVVITAAAVSWPSSTLSASAAVLYDSQSGSASTDPLIACFQFGSTVSDTSGTFQVSPDANLGDFYFFIK